MGLFKKAVKEAAKLRMAISGPSGSGKTYTALSLATHLAKGKPIAVVDTENGSASKYADIFAFDVAEMHAPFHPEKFIAAIAEATEAGYGVVILDSISHAWAGTGGVLDIVDQAAKRSRSGNTYTAWKEGTPVQNKLIDAIVQSGVHIIVTMRSKTEYVLQDDGRGKQAPKKIGMAPVQRGEFEYEFDIVLDMDIDNNGVVSKTRCPALVSGVFPRPGAEMAGIISAWLSDGAEPAEKPVTSVTPATSGHTNGNGHKPPTVEAPVKDLPMISELQMKRLHAVGTDLYGKQWDAKRPALVSGATKKRAEAAGVNPWTSAKDLTDAEADTLILGIQQRIDKRNYDAEHSDVQPQEQPADNPFEAEAVIA